MIALDTNLLVYAHHARLPEHRAAREAIERAADSTGGWVIPAPCIVEFWSVSTNPNLKLSSPAAARDFLDALVDAGAKIVYPRAGFTSRLTDLCVLLDLKGGAVFDAQIALIAAEAGAKQIWTHDRAFTRIPGVEILDPL